MKDNNNGAVDGDDKVNSINWSGGWNPDIE